MNQLKVTILTGPIHSGKSKALLQWINHKPVKGFVTPTIDNRKAFFDITNNNYLPYELESTSGDCITIGKYNLSKKAFENAYDIVIDAIQFPSQCFVMDEIGKLELNNEGHYYSLIKILQHWNNNLLLVVRDSLLNEVIKRFSLQDVVIINKGSLTTIDFPNIL